MITKRRGQTSEFVYQQIRRDLIGGNFMPGDKLTTEALARRYNVSRTPVREALAQLERDGLADSGANTGYVLRQVTIAEVCEIFELREVIEGLAARKLAEGAASVQLVDELRASCRARREAENLDEIESYDRMFHQTICRNCGSRAIQELTDNYMILLSSFDLSRVVNPPPRAAETVPNDQHEKIVDAIAAGDPARAERLMKKHIADARKNLVRFITGKH